MGQHIGCEYTKKCDCLEYAAVDERRLDEGQRRIFEVNGNTEEGLDTSGWPKKFPYYATEAKLGHLVTFYLESRRPIYECNARCNCGPGCKNRSVQFGRKVPLEIFKTAKRGWGLRCKANLQRGQFLDTYRGEIITDAQATRREDDAKRSHDRVDSYLYALDKFEATERLNAEDIYVVDGEQMGGPTRFMNHSCDPNCRQYTVSYNKYDARVYELAFFAYRDIPAGEELTFDYLDKDDRDEVEAEAEPSAQGQRREDGAAKCLCGAPNCRGWLWL